MTQIILDQSLRTKLHDLNQPLEICDESGKVLARLIPVIDQSSFEPIEPHLSPDELELRRNEPDFSTEDLLAHLGSL